MILKFCDENLLIELGNARYLDFFCYIIIFIAFILFFLLKSNIFSHNKFSETIKKIVIFITSISFLIFVSLTFIISLFGNSNVGCSCKYESLIPIVKKKDLTNKINKLELNKVIVIGDSRIEYITNQRSKYTLPINFHFIAKSGAGYSWFEENGLPDLKLILQQNNNNPAYHIVINMGVNDIQYTKDYIKISNDYYNAMKVLAIKYPKFKFYFLSVNPIDDVKIFNHDSMNIRSNEKIKKFNENINSKIKKDGLKNFNYCDSYNNINFKTPDGLHYNVETNQKVINYISDNCVQYK